MKIEKSPERPKEQTDGADRQERIERRQGKYCWGNPSLPILISLAPLSSKTDILSISSIIIL